MENKNIALDESVNKDSTPTATGEHQENAKAKFTLKKLVPMSKPKLPKIKIPKWIKRLARGIVIGFIIGIVLNIVDNYFWPDLSETIPTIFGFFNGFVRFTEFCYKVTFGTIASIFNGNFVEFNKSVLAEIGEMFTALWNWMSSISF